MLNPTRFLKVMAILALTATIHAQTIVIPTVTVSNIVHTSDGSTTSDILATGSGLSGAAPLPSFTVTAGSYTGLSFTIQAADGLQFQVANINGVQPRFLFNFYMLKSGASPALTTANSPTMMFSDLSGTNIPSFDPTGFYTTIGDGYYLDGGTLGSPATWYFKSLTFSIAFPTTVTYASDMQLAPSTTSSIRGMQFVHPDPVPSGGMVTLVPFVAVPEPAEYALIAGLGGLALAAWRRRR
jgi:hypothetical protein